MADESSRNSGLDGIGQLLWGSHFCQFYQDQRELKKNLVPYFRRGLEANELCLWVTSGDFSLPGLEDPLEAGRIETISCSEWYEPQRASAGFEHVFDKWNRKLESCRQRGYEGLRIAGDTAWLRKEDWKGFSEYEWKVNSAIQKLPVIALCTYPVTHWEPYEILDIACAHQFSFHRRKGRWTCIGDIGKPHAAGQPIWIPLKDLMNEIHFVLGPLARKKKIVLEIVPSGEDFLTTTDPSKLRRIVMELLSSALKYASAGGTVALSVEKKSGQFFIHGHVKAPDEYSRDSRFSVVLPP